MTEQEFIHRRRKIEQKLQNEELLLPEDIWFMGDCMHLDELPNDPQCVDPYFHRLYLHFMKEEDQGEKPLSEAHLQNLKVLVHEWLELQQHGNPAFGSLAAASQKETNKELAALQEKWDKEPETEKAERDEDLFTLIAWSKFRYILARRIFELDIKGPSYTLHLHDKEIIFDYESALHILSRHFGHGMKPYQSIKDHFYGVFAHNQLHLDFERILGNIVDSGFYVNQDVRNINFRYKGQIYKIWSHPIDETGLRFRVSTFFPISSPKRLQELEDSYNERAINEELSVFTRKAE